MSKKCPECESKNIHITYYPVPTDNMATCFGCGYVNLLERFPEQTVFDSITQSEEILAEKLVYYLPGVGWYFSTLFDGDTCWKTKAEAFAATVAKLREVKDE